MLGGRSYLPTVGIVHYIGWTTLCLYMSLDTSTGVMMISLNFPCLRSDVLSRNEIYERTSLTGKSPVQGSSVAARTSGRLSTPLSGD